MPRSRCRSRPGAHVTLIVSSRGSRAPRPNPSPLLPSSTHTFSAARHGSGWAAAARRTTSRAHHEPDVPRAAAGRRALHPASRAPTSSRRAASLSGCSARALQCAARGGPGRQRRVRVRDAGLPRPAAQRGERRHRRVATAPRSGDGQLDRWASRCRPTAARCTWRTGAIGAWLRSTPSRCSSNSPSRTSLEARSSRGVACGVAGGLRRRPERPPGGLLGDRRPHAPARRERHEARSSSLSGIVVLRGVLFVAEYVGQRVGAPARRHADTGPGARRHPPRLAVTARREAARARSTSPTLPPPSSTSWRSSSRS